MLDERITIKLLFAFACAGIWPVPARPQASTYPTVGNVFFVPEENKDFADIIGSASSSGCGYGSATGPGLLALLAVAILVRATRPSPRRRSSTATAAAVALGRELTLPASFRWRTCSRRCAAGRRRSTWC